VYPATVWPSASGGGAGLLLGLKAARNMAAGEARTDEDGVVELAEDIGIGNAGEGLLATWSGEFCLSSGWKRGGGWCCSPWRSTSESTCGPLGTCEERW